MRQHLYAALIVALAFTTPLNASAATTKPSTAAVEDLDTTAICNAVRTHQRIHAFGTSFVVSRVSQSGRYILADVTRQLDLAGDTVALQRTPHGGCRDIFLAPLGQITEADLREHGIPANDAPVLRTRYLGNTLLDTR